MLADESADLSCIEQVAICIRYVRREDYHYQAHEGFFTFLSTRDTTGVQPHSHTDCSMEIRALEHC